MLSLDAMCLSSSREVHVSVNGPAGCSEIKSGTPVSLQHCCACFHVQYIDMVKLSTFLVKSSSVESCWFVKGTFRYPEDAGGKSAHPHTCCICSHVQYTGRMLLLDGLCRSSS